MKRGLRVDYFVKSRVDNDNSDYLNFIPCGSSDSSSILVIFLTALCNH